MYQPPTQKAYWVNRVTEECYRPLFRGFVERPGIKATVNINSVLIDLLDQHGHGDVIDDIRTLLEREQIELTASAKYHALLPFLPEHEVRRQVELNNRTHKKYFGDAYRPKGFFPPEMAFSKEVAVVAADLGYEWIIVDELSFPGEKLPVDYSKLYSMEGLDDFMIHFREREASWTILSGQIGTGELLVKSLGDRVDKPGYLLTAMDGETFGHHRPGLEMLFFNLADSGELDICKLSDLKGVIKDVESIEPRPSTWALMRKDLERNAPFSRWKDPDNEIHQKQWELTEMAIAAYDERHKMSDNSHEDELDKSLHSDQYWWASARPWWSIEMIESGAKELYDAIIAADVGEDMASQAKEIYHDIVFTAFEWQRAGKVDELSRKEDEEFTQKTDAALPQLPRKEVEKMIAQLKKEMKIAAGKEQFERATQIRNRIKGIKELAADVENPQLKTHGVKEWDS